MTRVIWNELESDGELSEETMTGLMELDDLVVELHHMTIDEIQDTLNNECDRNDLLYILEGWEIVVTDKSDAELVELIMNALEGE